MENNESEAIVTTLTQTTIQVNKKHSEDDNDDEKESSEKDKDEAAFARYFLELKASGTGSVGEQEQHANLA